SQMDRIEAIVRSMTPHERVAPKIINGSRRARIAKGSGVHVSEVNSMLERFGEAQKMMKKLASGGAIPGMPGGRGGAKKGAKGGKKKPAKFGNPAKAAQLAAAEANKPKAPAGAAFGAGPKDFDPSELNLPKGFEKFLGK
ncbi:MAG: signal recognition particle protein, partial [Paeniglutamicibacter sp.]